MDDVIVAQIRIQVDRLVGTFQGHAFDIRVRDFDTRFMLCIRRFGAKMDSDFRLAPQVSDITNNIRRAVIRTRVGLIARHKVADLKRILTPREFRDQNICLVQVALLNLIFSNRLD